MLILALMTGLAHPGRAEAVREVPRTIIGLYDGGAEGSWFGTRLHHMAEMPLNYLGLTLMPWDLRKGLPDLKGRADVRGVMIWVEGDHIPVPSEKFLAWAENAVREGKRFVLFGSLPFLIMPDGSPVPLWRVNEFLSELGLRYTGQYVSYTGRSVIAERDPAMFGFEQPLDKPLSGFAVVHSVSPQNTVFLSIRSKDGGGTADLAVVGPHGGYVAGGYTHSEDDGPGNNLRWHLNPFAFLRKAFAAGNFPKPDVTTLDGRRIFLSQIDGDGWRNLSEIPAYRKERRMSSFVILREVIDKYPDLPVTVAPIAGDLDLHWCGTDRTREVAREIFRHPNVEAGSHSFSHPFDWGFFADPDAHAREARLKPLYRDQCGVQATEDVSPVVRLGHIFEVVEKFAGRLGQRLGLESVKPGKPGPEAKAPEEGRHSEYEIPRSYNRGPYDLNQEVAGSVQEIEALLPPGKTVRLFQWSGNALPYEAAIRATRQLGLKNINGGDSRLDDEYPSVAYVDPIGRRVGDEWQIYAPDSNENTYTNLWHGPYFGFKYLIDTLKRTEAPRRLKPIDVYYHMYSGAKLASIEALNDIFAYVHRQKVAPVFASTYAAIADGFYSTRIFQLGTHSWRLMNCGKLSTVRFDAAEGLSVDFGESKGILGERRHGHSLYVALDPSVAEPIVTLHHRTGTATRPYLIESRWNVERLSLSRGALSFRAWGFGRGVMSWQVPRGSSWEMSVTAPDHQRKVLVTASSDGLLALDLGPRTNLPVQVRLQQTTKVGGL